MPTPQLRSDVGELVDAIIQARGRRLKVALPLGLGKPVHIVNELTRRALDGELEELAIYTALSLARPQPAGDLQSRLMAPIIERLFGDCPELDYVGLRARGELPEHIRVHEFYFPPGSLLGRPRAQRDYQSVNFTDALREMRAIEPDLLAQMVAPGREGGWDLSCNTDLALDLMDVFDTRDDGPLVVGQVNRRLPAMGGSAEVASERFALVLDDERYDHELFGLPSMPPSDVEYAIGLRTASLLRDGGTIQVGIGNLGESVAWAALLRHREPETYRQILEVLEMDADTRRLVEQEGGVEAFEEGLYASSEMFVEGLLRMYEGGVVKRTVHEGPGTSGGGDGVAIHGGFYLGSPRFYESLRELSDDDRRRISMTSVRWTNLLYGDEYGDEATKRRQREQGRFINEAMMVTLSGAIVSDGLEDGRVVSGVGGQYEFVAQANALDDGRAIIMLPSVREKRGEVTSNIVFNYGHVTIPRHLRDIVVTEYGIANLRGKTDEEVAKALIEIADARFQESLAERAKAAGKLDPDWEIPAHARNNRRELISELLSRWRREGTIPRCAFGSALTTQELDLVDALRAVEGQVDALRTWEAPKIEVEDILATITIPDAARPYLERMGLAEPSDAREHALQRIVVYGLAAADIV